MKIFKLIIAGTCMIVLGFTVLTVCLSSWLSSIGATLGSVLLVLSLSLIGCGLAIGFAGVLFGE